MKKQTIKKVSDNKVKRTKKEIDTPKHDSSFNIVSEEDYFKNVGQPIILIIKNKREYPLEGIELFDSIENCFDYKESDDFSILVEYNYSYKRLLRWFIKNNFPVSLIRVHFTKPQTKKDRFVLTVKSSSPIGSSCEMPIVFTLDKKQTIKSILESKINLIINFDTSVTINHLKPLEEIRIMFFKYQNYAF